MRLVSQESAKMIRLVGTDFKKVAAERAVAKSREEL